MSTESAEERIIAALREQFDAALKQLAGTTVEPALIYSPAPKHTTPAAGTRLPDDPESTGS